MVARAFGSFCCFCLYCRCCCCCCRCCCCCCCCCCLVVLLLPLTLTLLLLLHYCWLLLLGVISFQLSCENYMMDVVQNSQKRSGHEY